MPTPAPTPYITTLRKATVDALTGLFPRVYDSRLPQLKRNLLPALRVYTTSENLRGRSISIPDFLTIGHIIVQIVCEDITDASIAEKIDLYVEIVKTKLLTDAKWLVLFERVDSIEIEMDRSVEGEWRLTTATIDFGVQYSTAYEPDIRDWLETVDMKIDVIDPAADPNTGPPGTPPNVEGGYEGGYPGPEGRIEVHFPIVNPGPPPFDAIATPVKPNGQAKGK
jgi:hypothetical protein